jgi:hypothetical protein
VPTGTPEPITPLIERRESVMVAARHASGGRGHDSRV